MSAYVEESKAEARCQDTWFVHARRWPAGVTAG